MLSQAKSLIEPPAFEEHSDPEQAPYGQWRNHLVEDSRFRDNDFTCDWLIAVLMRRWWRPSERWQGSGWRPHPTRFSKGNPVVGMGWFVDGIDQCAVHTPDDSRIAKWWLSFVGPSSISRSLTCFYLYHPNGQLFPIAAAGGG